jgi:hypothetical protein
VIAAQVCEVDVDRIDVAGRGGEAGHLVQRLPDLGKIRKRSARGVDRRVCRSIQARQRAQRVALRVRHGIGELVQPRKVLVAQRAEQLAVVAFAGGVQPGGACQRAIDADVAEVEVQLAGSGTRERRQQ